MFKKSKDKKEEIDINEFLAAEQELKELKEEYGIKDEKEGKLSHKISGFFERQAEKEPVAVSKKTYIILAILTGWFGGHRFYCKHYKVGLVYLLLFWMGIGLYHTILDLMVVIPMQPDENGKILL
ncbi:MAG: TM2 domain-containing protein [Agathobacter sp.]